MSFGPSIKASIGADTSQLKEDAGKAEGIIGNFAERTKDFLGEVGTGILKAFSLQFAAEKVGEFFKEIYQGATRLSQLSRELGVSTQALQAFKNIVEHTGADTEHLQQVWEKARDSLDELRAGSAGAEKNFAALGLSAADFIGLDLEGSLELIAKAWVENKNEAGAYDAVISILGKRNVPQLMEALEKLGEEGFAKAKEDADGFFESIGPGALSAFDAIKKGGRETLEFLEHAFANTFGHIVSGLTVLLRTVNYMRQGAGMFDAFQLATYDEAKQLQGESDKRESEGAAAAAAQKIAAEEKQAEQASKDRLANIERIAKYEAAGQDRNGKDIAEANKLIALREMMNDEDETELGRAAAKVEYEKAYLHVLERVGELQREMERAAPAFQAETYGVGQAAEAVATTPRESSGSLSQIHADLLGISNQLRNAGLL